MSDPVRIVLVGATGLVGRAVLQSLAGRGDFRAVAIARREIALPAGARMEMFIAKPADWGKALAAIRPEAVICALGTTWRKADKSEAAFRAVDLDLVLDVGTAARKSGVSRVVSVSSVGADPASRNFYLRIKGEAERGLAALGFSRLDILRPGLLRGRRGSDRRLKERAAIIASPVTDLLLQGKLRRFRSIGAVTVAQAALALASRTSPGQFVHEHDAIVRAARSLPITLAASARSF
jgi:uncharacterized protein YbjT (DUF2867 family)